MAGGTPTMRTPKSVPAAAADSDAPIAMNAPNIG
jgi:hypothetical protein